MHAISHHRFDHLPEGLGATLVRLLLGILAGLGTFRLMARRVARRSTGDDIGWEDGEPGDPADRN